MSDHKAEAEETLHTLVHDYNEIHAKLTRMNAAGEGMSADALVAAFLPMMAVAGMAQTRATLYLAEQQKRNADEAQTANLIAYLAICEERGAADDAYRILDASIRERLVLP